MTGLPLASKLPSGYWSIPWMCVEPEKSIPDDRATDPRAVIVELQNFVADESVLRQRARSRIEAGQQLGPEGLADVRRVHAAVRPVERRAAMQLVRTAAADDVVEQPSFVRVRLPRSPELERAFLKRIWIDVEHGVAAVAVLSRHVETVDEISAFGRRSARRRLRLQEHLRPADVDLVHDDAGHD